MAIRTVVTRGYGNVTFNGTIALVALRGYVAGVVTSIWTPTTPASSSWAAKTAALSTWTPETPASTTWT